MADKDITPELIENVNKEFDKNLLSDKKAAALNEKLTAGKADYKDAYDYAESVGSARAKAFGTQVNAEALPDGKMHYNIASRLLEDSLSTDHELVSEYAAEVQRLYNEKAGIGLKALEADIDQDRIKGFIESVCNAGVFDDVAWKLGEPVITHARSVVDDTIKKNAEFQHKAGLKATVKRRAASRCCKWCAEIDGEYTYPDVPREVFQRHDNCRCTVDYKGRKLTAYESGGKTHTFRDQGEQERVDRAALTENNKKSGEYIKRYESIQAAQSAGDLKQPLSMNENFDDFKPLQLTEDDRKVLLNLSNLAKQTNNEYGIAVYEGGRTDYQTNHRHNDIRIEYPAGSKNIKLFHCHTDESPFSGTDLAALSKPDVEKTHIICANGDAWTASVGQGIKPSKEEFDKVTDICYDEAMRIVREYPQFDSWSFEERYYMLVREQMRGIGNFFEWDISGGRL